MLFRIYIPLYIKYENQTIMRSFLLLCLMAVISAGCSTSKWADNKLWYDNGRTPNDGLADVFYITSTEVMDEKDAMGNDAYIAKLTENERKAMLGEMNFIRKTFGDSLNFFAPYYEQFTMSALELPQKEYKRKRAHALKEIKEAFRYYMKHKNNGRPFILAGFSQGGMHLVDMLKNIDKKDYEHMVTAYCMGYRLSTDDLSYPYVKAADSADDIGTIVSFNSVSTTDAIWPAVTEGAVTCMNPVSFSTNDAPATLIFKGDTLSVRIDKQHNVLIVRSPKIDSYRFPPLENLCKPGNLHHWDLLFYGENLRKNALSKLSVYSQHKAK